jgi:hypothetical protein
MPDIDGWHVRDLIAPLFFNDNTELHNLIRRRLILPYLTGSFHSSFIEEYAGGLLMALQKQDGGIRPILCGEVWRRCFASLAVNATPIKHTLSTGRICTDTHHILTSPFIMRTHVESQDEEYLHSSREATTLGGVKRRKHFFFILFMFEYSSYILSALPLILSYRWKNVIRIEGV